MTDKAELQSALSIQHGGRHYKGLAIQPVEYALANNMDCLQFSAIKYISRHKLKACGVEDLKKAMHFIQMSLEMGYGVTSDVQYHDKAFEAALEATLVKRKMPKGRKKVKSGK